MRLRNLVVAGLAMLILTATAVFFADELNQIWPAERKLADARRNLPFESLTARLPKGKPIPPTKALAAEVKQQWDEMEGAHQFGSGERTEMLKALHERTRDIFVTKPGTGFERMIPETPEEILAGDNTPRIRQPGEPAYFPVSAGEEVTQVQPDREFRDLHRIGVLSFLTSRNFGYAKDRDHVAGFKPHGFRFVPKNNPLRMDHVLLVGILVHDQPVVYLTDSLPSMEQVHAAKTRPLDLFEQAGLPSLCDGEDLYIVRKEETVRMLGAIRATRTCQSCHDAEVGDLLGAFSYTLRPAPKQTGREAAPEQSK